MDPYLILILLFIFFGSGYSSFKIGIREGVERALDNLRKERIINIDPSGEITPNLFYETEEKKPYKKYPKE